MTSMLISQQILESVHEKLTDNNRNSQNDVNPTVHRQVIEGKKS